MPPPPLPRDTTPTHLLKAQSPLVEQKPDLMIGSGVGHVNGEGGMTKREAEVMTREQRRVAWDKRIRYGFL